MNKPVSPEKQIIVNKLLPLLIREIGFIDSEIATNLRKKISGKTTPLYLQVTKGRALKTGMYNTPQGKVYTETSGLTTSVYSPRSKNPIYQIISIPEDTFFIRTNHGYKINRKGLITLTHELGHVARPNLGRLRGELESDMLTTRVLKKLGMEREARRYIESRPTAQMLERRMIQAARKRMTQGKHLKHQSTSKKYLG